MNRDREECPVCGGPMATREDVSRLLANDDLDTPLWAFAYCWTFVIFATRERCISQRRWASDRHIGEAREIFASYINI